ncbi:MAG: peptidase S41, partial [Paramuribaculum sp.]|nr:peptidase S41 [Paramuribaculum sp.]
TTSSAVTPLWMRDVKISPNGDQIAFTYKGDIYKVSSKGGHATRLTAQPGSYESAPVWSPDGSTIAFASDRYGGGDVFVMSAEGGTPTRLTFNSAKETPVAFTPDGKNVIFVASIQAPASTAQFPTARLSQVYSVPVSGGRAVQILGTAAESLSFLPDGQSFVYQDIKGFEDPWRKHHTSSVTRDIWLYNSLQGKHTNLSNHPGEDLNPVITPDGNTVFMLSERNGGSMNVYSFPVDKPSQVTALTSFTRHPVRFLSRAAANGILAYTYDGEIYTQAPNGQPKKLNITLTYDDTDPITNLSASRVSDIAVSPDGKQVAYISRGEVFVTATEYPSVKQITHTPEGESDLCWSPDGRELYYTSERSGHYNIYRAKITRKDDPNFSNATLVSEEPVIDDNNIDRTMPSISPDGKTMVFSADRTRLMALDLKSGNVRDLANAAIIQPHRNKGMRVNWSPDSKWITFEYINLHHDPYSDIAVVDMKTG